MTILHARVRLDQAVDLLVHPGASAVSGASAVYLEVLVLGRLARGERLAFHRYTNTTIIRRPDGAPLFEERFALEPGVDAAGIDVAMGGAGVLGTLFLLGDAGRDLPPIEESAGRYAGATRLPGGAGILVRTVGDRAEDIVAFLETVAAAAPLAPAAGLDDEADATRVAHLVTG
jgi:urease accessory protein UreH